MKHLTSAVRTAVEQKNWYSALTLALTLPDIASKLAWPNTKQGTRFVRWIDQNFSHKYTSRLTESYTDKGTVWINGIDFYALRCAVLHEGSFDTAGNMKNAVDRVFREFQFTSPLPNGNSIHCNSLNGKLQLEVHNFATDVADAVDEWTDSLQPDSDVVTRMSALMTITSLAREDGSFGF
ncbi:hypothetical protein [Arthrobacter rhombi]|uniref:hypothetical protein n=1 Tax=Arthrobacter rhombi TaxID=71253 RepID=UPI003FD44820